MMGMMHVHVSVGGVVSGEEFPDTYGRSLLGWLRNLELSEIRGRCATEREALEVQEACERLADAMENTGFAD